MPSGLIDEKDGMGSQCDGVGDFRQMQVHRLGIAGWQDQVGDWSLCDALAKIYTKILVAAPEEE